MAITVKEFLKTKEFSDMVEQIKSYNPGFMFKLPYYKMGKGQRIACAIVTKYCIKKNIITSMSFDMTLEGEVTEEVFKRL